MADTPSHDWRQTVRRRLAVAAGLFLAWTLAIEGRLLYLQVYRYDFLAAKAERQQSSTATAPAKRGDITDREGRVLAYSVDADTIYADPREIGDRTAAAAALCGALGDCSREERQALSDRLHRGQKFAYVRRQATPEQARRVAELQLEGIGFVKESRRFYPNKELGSHLLGWVGLDNIGLGGIEATYDWLIKGRPGTFLIQVDARRHVFSRLEKPPTAGASLELTIDQFLQYAIERELKAGVLAAGAAGGSAIVMDPATGEILALANYPTFNPNGYRGGREEQARNRAIQDLYEPGSTFKIVTAGAALEEKLVTPDTPIDTAPGTIRFGSRVIDEDKGHNYGLLTFKGVIVRSSNVGAIKVGLQVGPQRLTNYVSRFGFGRPASPDFRGESPGIVWAASKLTDSALASVSMGYQVGVTPLQMAAAMSVVANGGELLQPRAVRAVIRDGERQPVPRKVLGRAISPGVAAELTDIMEGVVTDGTGKASQVDGYTIAGKTGTAQKVINGRYSHTDYNVSFVGFVPSRNPKFTIVVVIDTPRKLPPYGGTVAAPIFQKIASAALRQYGVRPSINPAPPILVKRQAPHPEQVAGSAIPAARTITAIPAGNRDTLPDLAGASAREVVQLLGRLGMTVRVVGKGIVVRQEPKPGAAIHRGAQATVWLDREPPLSLASDRP